MSIAKLKESLVREGFKSNVRFLKDYLKTNLNKTIVVSIDLGNGFIKFVYALLNEDGTIGEIIRVIEPSVVLEKKYKEVSESFGSVDGGNYYSLNVGGNEYVVGEEVGNSEKAITLYAKTNRVNEQYVVSIVGMLEKHIGIEVLKEHTLHLCFGKPNNDKKVEDDMINALVNLKQGVKNGIPFDIDVVSFEIFDQSNSALYSQLYNDLFKPQNEHYLKGSYPIADLGFGTLDLSMIKDKDILESETRSYDFGIVEVIKEVQIHIKKEIGVDISFNKIHDNFKDGYVQLTKTKTYDYSEFKNVILKSYANKIKNILTTQFGRLEMTDGILLFGGTATVIYPYLVEEFENIDVEIILAENSQMAISDGQFKRGVNNRAKMISFKNKKATATK